MAKNNPVRICTPKQIPNKEPKFQRVVMLEGVGRSIKELLTILITGCVVRIGLNILIYFTEGPSEKISNFNHYNYAIK